MKTWIVVGVCILLIAGTALPQSEADRYQQMQRDRIANIESAWARNAAEREMMENARAQYVVALEEQEGLSLSDGSDWTLEVGEVFPFVRWVSESELKRGPRNPDDKTFMLVKMDNLWLLVPSSRMGVVAEKDRPTAAMTYRQIVQAHRQSTAQAESDNAEAQGQNDAQQIQNMQAMLDLMNQVRGLSGGQGSSGLSRTDRYRMLSELRSQGMISSIRKNEDMPDGELIEAYNRALEQKRLRGIENAIRGLQP